MILSFGKTLAMFKEKVQNHFFDNHHNGVYTFKPEFDTQRKLTDYFKKNLGIGQKKN
jgi:hypothetical protein